MSIRAALENAIGGLWVAWIVYWWISSRDVKATIRHESVASRLAHVVPLSMAAWMIAAPKIQNGWLTARFVPASTWIYFVGVLIVGAGLHRMGAHPSRPQLERHSDTQARSRVRSQRPVSLRAPPDLHRVAGRVRGLGSCARRAARDRCRRDSLCSAVAQAQARGALARRSVSARATRAIAPK